MAFNSINTNSGAVVALQSLNRTNDQLDVVQKRVSTGYRVADARDDGGAFAVAQKVRGDIAGVTSANEQLGAAKGLLDTTLSGLNRVSDTMATIRGVVVKLADNNVTGALRTSYEEQYTQLRNQVGGFINDSTYNGVSLLGVSENESGATAAAGSSVTVIRNEIGGNISIAGQASGAFDLDDGAGNDAAAWTTYLTGTGAGSLAGTEQAVNTALNTYGNASKTVVNQIGFNKDKIDALESGLGALIDADLAKESARLQSLQIRQQLGATALSAANSGPQFLLSLFR
jgi:flagellin